MKTELKTLEKKLLEDEGILKLNAIQIEEESLKAAELGSEELAKKLLAHHHYQSRSKEIGIDHEVNPYTLARKIEVAVELGKSGIKGVGPARFGLALRKLAEKNDMSGFVRLTSSYIEMEMRNAEKNKLTKDEAYSLAIKNMKYASKLADTHTKQGMEFVPSTSKTTITTDYFNKSCPNKPALS